MLRYIFKYIESTLSETRYVISRMFVLFRLLASLPSWFLVLLLRFVCMCKFSEDEHKWKLVRRKWAFTPATHQHVSMLVLASAVSPRVSCLWVSSVTRPCTTYKLLTDNWSNWQHSLKLPAVLKQSLSSFVRQSLSRPDPSFQSNACCATRCVTAGSRAAGEDLKCSHYSKQPASPWGAAWFNQRAETPSRGNQQRSPWRPGGGGGTEGGRARRLLV